MENHRLHIEKLSTGFLQKRGKKRVLQEGFSADLKSGEMICLLGPNGAGKSTLMRTLLGLQRALEGSVHFDDFPLSDLSVRQLSRKVAVVFTDRLDDIYLKVNEVVAMGRYPFAPLSGKLTEKDRQAVTKALVQVEMQSFAHQTFFNLSDGEKQKVLMARALVQETPFIFFDEPVAFIDAPGKIAVMELLREIVRKQNKGILLTTHDIDLALHYADKLWLMGNGRPFVQGIPEDLVLQKSVQQYFYHQGIRFDIGKGKFIKQRSESRNKVEVSGKEVPVIWLIKALERKGFEVHLTERKKLRNGFYFENDTFVCLQNGVVTGTFLLIEEVLNKMKECFGGLELPFRP